MDYKLLLYRETLFSFAFIGRAGLRWAQHKSFLFRYTYKAKQKLKENKII